MTRRRAVRAIVGAAGAALLAAPAVAVPCILYEHVFGTWQVVCWSNLERPEKSCFIDSPPIAYQPGARSPSVRVTPAGQEGFRVEVSSRSGTRLGTPVRLSVDDGPVRERPPDVLDHARFAGTEAAAIVEEMKRGRELRLSFPATGKEAKLPLAGFGEAMAALAENLRGFAGAGK